MKPVVIYTDIIAPPTVGRSAWVVPENHPRHGQGLTNGDMVRTSTVVEIKDIGFETLNTRYMPKPPATPQRIDEDQRLRSCGSC